MTVEALKNIGALLLAGTALPRLAQRAFFTKRLTIVMYHSVVRAMPRARDGCVVGQKAFGRQMRYLKKNFEVLNLTEALERLRECRTPLRPLAAVTFDDGYQTVHDVAWPILREASLPASVFLNTGFVGTSDTVWFGRLYHAVAETPLPWLDWMGCRWDLTGSEAKSACGAGLQRRLKGLQTGDLAEELRKIILALQGDPDRSIAPDSPFRFLDVKSIEAMAATGLIEFGAHTRTHTILTRLAPGERADEIRRSIREVEQLTGRPCKSFAYPNGRRQDYDGQCIEILQSLGVKAAVTTEEGANDCSTPPLELKRYGIDSRLSLAGFDLVVHHWMSSLRRMISWRKRSDLYES
jgi:peptidoglycan/xylan/chitin deacetylase (PgdA/CDA1 family)